MMNSVLINEYLEEFHMAIQDVREHKTLATVGIALTWWESLLKAIQQGHETEQLSMIDNLTQRLPSEWDFWISTWNAYYVDRTHFKRCH